MKSKSLVTLLLLCAFIIILSSSVLAGDDYDLVVVNSNDWVDVYNSLLYGALSNTQVIFLSDQSQSNIFFNDISYATNSILVVESDERLSPTASRILSSLGYEVEVLTDEDTSLFFAELLNLDSFILIDENFPSNGLSVAPYAVATDSWVFFVDADTDSRVIEVVDGATVVTYGRVPQNILQATVPSLVIDEGNKYRNSVKMAKEFLEIHPTKQYILTEGSFLEDEFFIDAFPVIIVGVSTTPAPIEDFFVESDVQSAVVVGQLSVPPSVALRRFLISAHDKEIKLVAKLGQTIADGTDQNNILPLDTFPIPSPKIGLAIENAFYNQITQQLEVRFSNDGDVLVTYVPGIVVTSDGETTVLDPLQDFYLLERGESRTIQFPVELDAQNEPSIEVTAVYGESQDSFDLSVSKEFSPLEFISIVDDSIIQIQDIVYDLANKVFLISVYNNGTVPTYADFDLIDVIVGGETQSFSSPRAVLIQPGQSSILVIYGLLSQVDILANPLVTYEVSYGQRNFALIKSLRGELPLSEKSSLLTQLLQQQGLLIGAISIVVILLLLFFLLRRDGAYECLSCGRVHEKKPKRCMACGFGKFRKKR